MVCVCICVCICDVCMCVCVCVCAHCRDELKEKYEGKLSKTMTGQFYEVFSKVLRVLVGRKVTVPGTYKK